MSIDHKLNVSIGTLPKAITNATLFAEMTKNPIFIFYSLFFLSPPSFNRGPRLFLHNPDEGQLNKVPKFVHVEIWQIYSTFNIN